MFPNVEPNIDPGNPFNSDDLERRPVAEHLTTLLSSLSQPTVFAVNSPWGTGKSFFLRRWQAHLTLEKFHCLYFNAWEHDSRHVCSSF